MTEQARQKLAAVARRNAWDANALYAVALLATAGTCAPNAGVQLWTPERTRVGLLQFDELTARRLGVERSPHPPTSELAKYSGSWATWTLAAMALDDQIDLLEAFYRRAFSARKPKRPVDYYLAAWGAAPGLEDSTVVAVLGDSTFRPELDRDQDGKIAVGDLSAAVTAELSRLPRGSDPGPFYDVLWSLAIFVLTRRVQP